MNPFALDADERETLPTVIVVQAYEYVLATDLHALIDEVVEGDAGMGLAGAVSRGPKFAPKGR